MKYYVAEWIIDSDKIMDGSFRSVLSKSVELDFNLKFEDFMTDDEFYGFRFAIAVEPEFSLEDFFKIASDKLSITSWAESTSQTYENILGLSIREQRNNSDYKVNLRVLDSYVKAGLMNKNRRQ